MVDIIPQDLPPGKLSPDDREGLQANFPFLTSDDIEALNSIVCYRKLSKIMKANDPTPDDGEMGRVLREVRDAADTFLTEVEQAFKRFSEVIQPKQKKPGGSLLAVAYRDGCNDKALMEEDFWRYGAYSLNALRNVTALRDGVETSPYTRELLREGKGRRPGSSDFREYDIVQRTAGVFKKRLGREPERHELKKALELMGADKMTSYIRKYREVKGLKSEQGWPKKK